MGSSKHTEAQIIAALKQVEAGRTVDDVARECGVSQATIYTWKAKFGGMDVSEAQRLRSRKMRTRVDFVGQPVGRLILPTRLHY